MTDLHNVLPSDLVTNAIVLVMVPKLRDTRIQFWWVWTRWSIIRLVVTSPLCTYQGYLMRLALETVRLARGKGEFEAMAWVSVLFAWYKQSSIKYWMDLSTNKLLPYWPWSYNYLVIPNTDELNRAHLGTWIKMNIPPLLRIPFLAYIKSISATKNENHRRTRMVKEKKQHNNRYQNPSKRREIAQLSLVPLGYSRDYKIGRLRLQSAKGRTRGADDVSGEWMAVWNEQEPTNAPRCLNSVIGGTAWGEREIIQLAHPQTLLQPPAVETKICLRIYPPRTPSPESITPRFIISPPRWNSVRVRGGRQDGKGPYFGILWAIRVVVCESERHNPNDHDLVYA